MENMIGERIAKLRRQKAYTQEQLGEMVGVSGQAVSKWENGGVPDTYLLPHIAKALDVTIDALFGAEKKISEITEQEILCVLFDYCSYHNSDKDFDKFKFLFETLWSVQCAILGNEVCPDLSETVEKYSSNPQITSQIINNKGTTYLSLVKDFPFFCAVQDTPEVSKKLLGEENFCEFFSLFADKDAFGAIIFTQTAEEASLYTAKSMAEKMGMTLEKFLEIVPLLVKYGFLREESMLLDDEKISVYHKWSNPEIRAILIMAYQYMHARQCYFNFTCNRTKPYLENRSSENK